MYESAHFISSRTLSGFEGYPFGDDLPDYPTRLQVLDYLRAFARDRGLEDRITLTPRSTAAERSEDGWEVQLAGRRDADLLPPGRRHRPPVGAAVAELPGRVHRRADPLPRLPLRRPLPRPAGADRRRGQLGLRHRLRRRPERAPARRSASAAATGSSPSTCSASPPTSSPTAGRACRFGSSRRCSTGVMKLLVGDLTRYGLPAPDHRVLESHPIMNTQVLHYMGHGDLVARADIAELRGDRVLFADGVEEPFDLIVWATGYEVSMPFLDRDVFDWRGDPARPLPAPVPPLDGRPLGDGPVRGRRRAPIRSSACRAACSPPRSARSAPAEPRRERWRGSARHAPDLSGGTRHVNSPRHDISIQDAAYQSHVRRLLTELDA